MTTDPHPAPSHQRIPAPGFLILLLSVLVAILLVASQAVNVADRVRQADVGRLLVSALLLRSQAEELPGAYLLARAIETDGKPAAAKQADLQRRLQQASTALADLPGGQWLRGVALGSLGQYDSAEALLRTAAGDDPFAALALGNVLDEQDRIDDARAVWQPWREERALSLQLYRTGIRLSGEGREQQAEALLLKAVAVDPTFADAHLALGGYYWGADRVRAIESYRTALAVGGLEPFLELLTIGRIAWLDGQWAEAATALREALQWRPNHPDTPALYVAAMRHMGRTPEAILFLEALTQQTPSPVWSLVALGGLYIEQHEFDRAVQTLTAAAELRPDVSLIDQLLAQARQGLTTPAVDP